MCSVPFMESRMTRKIVHVATKTPPTPAVRRRRAVLVEAGLEHGALADAIERLDGVPTSRNAITNSINGHFDSARIQDRLVELIRQAFVASGREARAEQITHEYMGWPSPVDRLAEAGLA
jgi:hypothetical protein